MNNFRKNLRDELDYQVLTVKELAAKTGIPKSSLDSYLSHNPKQPTIEVAVKIAQALHCSVEYLVTGEEYSSEASHYKVFQKIIYNLSLLQKDKLHLANTMIQALIKE